MRLFDFRSINRPINHATLLLACLFGLAATEKGAGFENDTNASASPQSLVLVVTDPLSDRLACDCVQGYAQRKYEMLGRFLQEKLGVTVKVFWGDSIAAALRDENKKLEQPVLPDIVIGKYSMIVYEAQQNSWKLSPEAQLTGKDGGTTQWGLIVVRAADAALLVEDLTGYRILFGPPECDEKYAAPRELLVSAEIDLPANAEIADSCSQAAKQLLEFPPEEKVAAVISSYAAPLLEGCGTIKKGDLRVIGKSDEVPFITAFVRDDLAADLRTRLVQTIMSAGEENHLLQALETRDGFVAFHADAENTALETSLLPDQEKKTK